MHPRDILGIAILLAVTSATHAHAQFGDMGQRLKPRVQQVTDAEFRLQTEALLRSELYLACKICDPSPAEYAELVRAGKAEVEYLIARALEFFDGERRARPIPSGTEEWTAANRISSDQQRIARALLNIAKEKLRPERAKLYQLELEQREDTRRLATANLIVAQMDAELMLRQEQRDAIARALMEHWRPGLDRAALEPCLWFGYRPMYRRLERVVVPVLDEKQLMAWQSFDPSHDFGPGTSGMPEPLPPLLAKETWARVHHVPLMGDPALWPAERRGDAGEVAAAVPLAANLAEDYPGRWVAIDEAREAFYKDLIGRGGQARDEVRKIFEARLQLRLDEARRDHRLSTENMEKLELAGRGEIEQFFDQAELAIDSGVLDFLQTKDDEKIHIGTHADLLAVRNSALLFRRRAKGMFDRDSLFEKCLSAILRAPDSHDQQNAERKQRVHAAQVRCSIDKLEWTVPLVQSQRERLAEVILADPAPAEPAERYEYETFLYLLAQIPEAKLRPIFDDPQWKRLSLLLAEARNIGKALVEQGCIEER